MTTLDLNADMGEAYGAYSFGEDPALLESVTSASIACGFHAGDFTVMERAVRAACSRGVRIGAHPGYPDRYGFGRRPQVYSPSELCAMIVYQVGALDAIARFCGARVAYIKLHGALYHAVSYHEAAARAVLDGVMRAFPEVAFVAPCNSPFLQWAQAMGCVAEAEWFADRQIEADGSLTPRTHSDAMIADVKLAVTRIVRATRDGVMVARTGEEVPVRGETVCVHGDGPGAGAMTRELRAGLEAAGIRVAAPAR
ncbi:MAG: LamB/YcsF family protein [Firmicutes bacterium]|nr:LamB/YcsF family protein [Bacillota bacterium]